VPRLGDEHHARAAAAEHTVNGVDGTLHNTGHVGVKRSLTQPLQARPQRFFVNVHAITRFCMRYHGQADRTWPSVANQLECREISPLAGRFPR
jgi:hypothetical protein